jgi:hypothetical protein
MYQTILPKVIADAQTSLTEVSNGSDSQIGGLGRERPLCPTKQPNLTLVRKVREVPLSVVSCCSKMRLYDRQQGITRVPVVVKLPVNDRFGQAPQREETSVAVRQVSRAAHGPRAGGAAPL